MTYLIPGATDRYDARNYSEDERFKLAQIYLDRAKKDCERKRNITPATTEQDN
ncbi:hypothetical protein ACFXPR_16180 [Nocardia tengchongensis]|uniref:hypothetical protein n=1 Tax=Nocardia tengchongensis TaxID=2055889 RepID=UPI00368EB197